MFFLAIWTFFIFLCKTGESVNIISEFESMKTCLKAGGIKTSNIASRSERDSNDYNSLNFQWQLRGNMIHPLAYILVQNEQEIQRVVACGRKTQIRIVPKGGGHSFERYSFGDSRSVVVDLRKMSAVVVHKSSMTATVGPGVLMGGLYAKLWQAGKFFIPAGTCPSVGISGLSTGGGYGYFSRTYGLTSDQIVEMNVVSSDGSLLKVNNVSNSDLFWALRGAGGGGFGIVSKFIFKVRLAPPVVFLGILEYDLDVFPTVFTKWQQYFDAKPPRTMFSQMSVGAGIIRLIFADSSGRSNIFERIKMMLPPAVNISGTPMSFVDFLLVQANSLEVQTGELFEASMTINSLSDLEAVTREFEARSYYKAKSYFINTIHRNPNIDGFYALISEMPTGTQVCFETFGGAISDIVVQDTAFAHRDDKSYLALALYIQLNPTPEENARGELWLQEFYDCGTYLFNSRETYQNYVDADLTDYLQRYYAANLPRLVEIKKKYDPQNYFNNPQSIPLHI